MCPVTWCERCGDVREYPHDCPYVAGTRRMPVMKKKKDVPLPWALAIIIGAFVLSYGIVWFAAWWGRR